jgi:hypothetical protein
MSYIRRFWTPNSEAARFRSREFSGELRKICTNFFVSNPREESYLDDDSGVPARPIERGLARDDRTEDDEAVSSVCGDEVRVGDNVEETE